MSSLVTIVVFGIVGAVMMAALLGLLLVLTGRAAGRSVQVAFGAMSVAVLLTVPALAASTLLAGDPAAGFGGAFLVAFCVVAVIYLANVALFPMAARRVAAEHGTGRSGVPTPSPAALAVGLLVCAAFGLASTGTAVLVG
ncbi:hypothetical protein [Allosalinactinospora lopnorensis]|uniref:hypothetical protein n=1 Tax=Allosalinactinospora lopnorensis TaxID=1352348 RepID=UPI000623CFFA|nr:hypothetical protein [Allosalinactinospora lopnorensis]